MIQKTLKLVLLVLCVISFQNASAQIAVVTGTVTDGSNGMPLPAVSIVIKGTTKGVSSDFDGNYKIVVPSKSSILVFKYVGYTDQEIPYTGANTINVTLKPSTEQLTEVVVTALGITKDQKKIGYSVTEVGGDNMNKARETNVMNSMAGRVAGLSIKGTSGGPGSTSVITIRGVSNLSGTGGPLFIIDGVPMDNTQRGASGEWGGSDGGDGIGNISPDDIEKMTVLKGQAASALYGARASNGVILVTTKKGKKNGDWSLNYNSNFVAVNALDYTDFQEKYGSGTGGKKPSSTEEALKNTTFAWGGKLDGTMVPNAIGTKSAYSKASKNYLSYYRTGSNFTNSVSLAKGWKQGSFRLSYSGLNAKGVVPSNSLTRNTINVNVEQNITDKFTITSTINYTNQHTTNQPQLGDKPLNPSNFKLLSPNVNPTMFSPGYNKSTGAETLWNSDQFATNPYFVANQGVNNPTRKRTISIISGKYNFTNKIYAMVRVGNDARNDTKFQVTPWGTAYSNKLKGGLNSKAQITNSETNYNGILSGQFDLNSDLSLDALIGGNIRKNSYESTEVGGSPFVLPYLYTPTNVTNVTRKYSYNQLQVNSGFYSLELSYKNFLTLTNTGRYDVFSTLTSPLTSNNSIFVPSISGAFVFNKFLHVKALDFAKLRASYAVTSGQPSGAYQNQLYYTVGRSIKGNTTATPPSTLPNLYLKPYTTSEIELGLNLKFFKNRLGFDATYFKKTSHNEIQNAPYTWASGFGSGVIANGSIQNQGLELLLTGVPIRTDNFSWDVSLNFTNLRNKVLKTDTSSNPIQLGTDRFNHGAAVTAFVVGKSGPQIRAYDYAYNKDGTVKLDDKGLPVRGDMKNFGSVIPKFYGGLNNNFKYKNFNLAFLIDYNFGNKILSNTEAESIYNGLNKITLNARETGKSPNNSTATPEAYYKALAQNITGISVVSGNFIKLRQFTLGYSLPAKMFKKVGFLKGITFSLVGRNLFFITRAAKNINPENTFGSNIKYKGIEGNSLPSNRTFGFNVNFKIK